MSSVVLGGDTPLGPPLIAGLEKEGYIVITSVASTNAVSSLESTGNGYVRALVLDPAEVSKSANAYSLNADISSSRRRYRCS